MQAAILNNGVEMPIEGYGTYRIPPEETAQCVLAALNMGYRSIDTAQCYGNEGEVGAACRKSGLPRQEIFITTKLWGCRGYDDAIKSISSSLELIDLEYIDLLLIHEPTGDIFQIYKAMEDYYAKGHIRAIGVSNFMEELYLELLRNCKIIPAVNQVETHIFRQQKELIKMEKEHGTHHESWSPLAAGKEKIFQNPVLTAMAAKHGKTPAQIALRFLVQQEIIIIPKSGNQTRMRENLDIFDFSLSEAEMNELRNLDRGRSLFNWW